MRFRIRYALIALALIVSGVLAYGMFRFHEPAGWFPSTASGRDAGPDERRAVANPPSGERQPAIKLESNRVAAGVISHQTPTVKTVQISNTGTADLVIEKIHTTCGCVKAEMAQKVIPPGNAALLSITINPARLAGFDVRKSIYLWSNDPRNRNTIIKLTGKVDPEFTVEPDTFDFGGVPAGKRVEASVILRQTGEDPVELVGLTPVGSPAGLALSFVKRPQTEWAREDRPEYKILIDLSSGNEVAAGQYRAVFNIETTCKRVPRLRYVIKANIEKEPTSPVKFDNGSQ